MSIKVTDENNKIHNIEVIKFSDGCYNVKVPDVEPKVVSVFIEDAVVDMHLLDLVVGAYHEMGVPKLNHLFIPYLPNARADRVFKKGNPLPLQVTLQGNWLRAFDRISTQDLHSEVSEALMSDYPVTVTDQYQLVKDHCHSKFDIVCSPDKGAVNKAMQVADNNNAELIRAHKVRDVNTGRILSTELAGDYDVGGKSVLITDDICDGGGTFIPLARLLKEQGASEVILFVSHGIFAKGLEIFEESVDKIYTANIVCNYITRQDLQKFNMRKEK